ncbi:MAG: peptidoglycan DD-metalloendopeptidase family protein [Deltaproteobacteria bacterium]|nr:peptidoglycan DD-metalloendopeptidase family protein [Deltaproteobacteria bacterium]
MLLMFLLAFSPFLVTGDVCPADDVAAPESKEEQIKQIETDLSHEKEQYLEFDQKEKSLLDQLSDIEKVVNGKRILLRELSEDINKAQEDLEEQRAALKGLEESYYKMKTLLNKRLGALYKYAKRAYLRVFASTNDLSRLNHMIKYLRVVLDKDVDIIKRTAEEYENYTQQVSLIEKKIKTIADLKEEESGSLASLNAETEKKVILLTRVHREKEFYETAVKELGSAAEGLKNTIIVLDNREDENKGEAAALPSGFGKIKGKLPLPVKGKILKENRQSGDKIFNSHRGIYIGGAFGDDVYAVFPGRVDYSGQIKGYGQVIVINHGERFFTISAYLSRLSRSEGEMVDKGEMIGQVGEAGLLTGPALYFEIRKGESNLDPLIWLKVN